MYFLQRYENEVFDVMFQELNLPLTIDEHLNATKQLNNNKSFGPDIYNNDFLSMERTLFYQIFEYYSIRFRNKDIFLVLWVYNTTA